MSFWKTYSGGATNLGAWFRRSRAGLPVLAVGLLFVVVYSWFYGEGIQKFTSPDETANYFFARYFAETGTLRVAEPLNTATAGLVHPRSIMGVDGATVPGSFLGMTIIYGLIAKVVGSGVLLWLTPFFSLVGVYSFYVLIKGVFGNRVAFISALLLFVLPPFWYYSSRGMFHNVLFVNLLLIGLALLSSGARAYRRVAVQRLYLLGSGAAVGLALLVRFSEISWVLVIFGVCVVLYRKTLPRWNLATVAIPVVLVVSIVMSLNSNLYGSPFSFSYTVPSVEEGAASTSTGPLTVLTKIAGLILPFGVDIPHGSRIFYQYVLLMFPWFSILLAVALGWWVRVAGIGLYSMVTKPKFFRSRPFDSREAVYVTLYIFVSLWLWIYYGAFHFSEYFDPTKTILGSSYLRYWLPIFVFGLPLGVAAIDRISRLFKRRWQNVLAAALLLGTFCLFSTNTVLNDPLHGLRILRQQNTDARQKIGALSPALDAGSVVISGFADKLFFPEYRVIVSLPSDEARVRQVVDAVNRQHALYLYVSQFDPLSIQSREQLVRVGYRLDAVYVGQQEGELLYRVY